MTTSLEATAGGVLHPWRRALLPTWRRRCTASCPHLYRVVESFEEPMLAVLVWPVSLVTRSRMSIRRQEFRSSSQRSFSLLGIASDTLGFLVLALVSATGDRHFAATIWRDDRHAYGLRRAPSAIWPYLLAPVFSWFGFFGSGRHPGLRWCRSIRSPARRGARFFRIALPTQRRTR